MSALIDGPDGWANIPRPKPPSMIGNPPASLGVVAQIVAMAAQGHVFDRAVYRDALAFCESQVAANHERYKKLRGERQAALGDPQAKANADAELTVLMRDGEDLGALLAEVRRLLEVDAPEVERKRKAKLKAAEAKRKVLGPQVAEALALLVHAADVIRSARLNELEIALCGGIPQSVWNGQASPLSGGDDGGPPLQLYDSMGRALDIGPSRIDVAPRVGDRVRVTALVNGAIIPPTNGISPPLALPRDDTFTTRLGLGGPEALGSSPGLRIERLEG